MAEPAAPVRRHPRNTGFGAIVAVVWLTFGCTFLPRPDHIPQAKLPTARCI